MNFTGKAGLWIWQILVVMLLATVLAAAQSRQDAESLIKEKKQLGFAFALDTKLSRVNGEYASFVGFQAGMVIKPNIFIGVGGYGRPTEHASEQMGYGGLVIHYTFRPHKAVNYSIGGLLGAGSAEFNKGTFFVAEPQATLFLNVIPWFRVGFGEGYRFIGNTGWSNSRLRGPWAGITLAFCRR
jgi:hypothetical protein